MKTLKKLSIIFASMFMLAAFAGCDDGECESDESHVESNADIISRKSGQKIQKIANLQYYKSKANYGTKKKGISR